MITGKKLAKKVEVEFPKSEKAEGGKKTVLILSIIFVATVIIAFSASWLIWRLNNKP